MNTNDNDPQRDVVLYDGECIFCTSQIANLRRLDGKNRLTFVSLHDPIVAEKYPDLTRDMLMEQMWIVAPDGRRFGGADGIRYLTTRLPLLYPLIPIMYFPFAMPLWRFLYRIVANSRYKIAGRSCENGTCSLHYKPKPASKA